MNIEGKWKGYYEYGVGYQLPFFGSRVEMQVEFVVDQEGKFTGTITEIPSDFSVPMDAKINGFIDIDLISFIKSYPSHFQINPDNTMKVSEGSLDIQYTGYIDEKNHAIYGEWSIEDEFTNEEGFDDTGYSTGIWLIKR